MLKVAVAGNPNSGKTSVFNALTGEICHVGNYPGVTVEFFEGTSEYKGEKFSVTDLPGIYSLTAYSQEEIVARDFLIENKHDVVLNVVDASNLERNLFFTLQLIELGGPVVLALNMFDIAQKRGININVKRLSELLGVIAVPVVARRKIGFEELKAACFETAAGKLRPKPPVYAHELYEVLPKLENEISKLKNFPLPMPVSCIALKLLEGDKEIVAGFSAREDCKGVLKAADDIQKHIKMHSGEDAQSVIVESRYAYISGLMKECVTCAGTGGKTFSDRIDSVVCGRFTGFIILLAVVYALFVFVFKLSDGIKWLPWFGGEWYSPVGFFEMFFQTMNNLASEYIHSKIILSLVNDAVINGVGGVIGFVPLIFFMFIFIAIMEDSGYIARVAFILDRLLKTFGLQGKSILAMIISGGLGGGGCAVPGVMAARTLREEKDKLITILVAPMMNCGAKMPVYAMLIAAFFPKFAGGMMFILWLLSWVFALIAAFFLRKVIVRGEQTPFVMEMPIYHLPRPAGIIMHSGSRTWLYIKKAATVILGVNIILWALMYFPVADNTAFEKEKTKSFFTLKTELERNGVTIASVSEIADAVKVQNKPDGVSEIYAKYKTEITGIDARESHNQLVNSYAGKIGLFFTPVSRLAGFDWKDNISLIGGWAAKELVIGVMGTAYSMGDVKDDRQNLSTRLAADSNWSPLKAFAFMVFVMVYAPCLVTVVTIRRETGSWKWAAFSTVFATTFGFILAVIIYQTGLLIL